MPALANKKSIVVGIDGSEAALDAARWAGAMAARMRVPLVVVNVIPLLVPVAISESAWAESELRDAIREEAKRWVSEAVAAVHRDHPEVEVSEFLEEGAAGHVLVTFSEQAQIVVVGASRFDRLGTVILGSTALWVSNNARCPVAVWRGRHAQPLPSDRPVLVGVDGSPLSDAAVGHAFEIASALGVSIVAVHAWATEGLLQWTAVPASWREVAEQERALLSERLAGWTEKYPDVQVAQYSVQNEPARTLLDRARDAQLVVVGSHGRNRVTGVLLGSTSQNLLHHSPCPVLICRSNG
jgi:nucleotide-binding universal stress UspA family protein